MLPVKATSGGCFRRPSTSALGFALLVSTAMTLGAMQPVAAGARPCPARAPDHPSANHGPSGCLLAGASAVAATLTLRTVTYGATGTFRYRVRGPDSGPATTTGSATTTRRARSTLATGNYRGKRKLGHYTITELSPKATSAGYWTISGVVCDGEAAPATHGRVNIHLSSESPVRDCTFYNTFIRGKAPSVVADAAMTVSKRTRTSPVYVRDRVRWTMVIHNHGSSATSNVFLTDVLPWQVTSPVVRSSAGRCRVIARRVNCSLGTVRSGSTVRITLSAVARRRGSFRNAVALSMSSIQESTRWMRATARARIIPRPLHLTG